MVLPLLLLIAGANPYLDDGRALSASLHYAQAEAKLKLALQAPTSTREERLEALDLLARALAAQGRFDEAEHAYAELLQAAPETEPPANASPKLTGLFDKARRRLYPPDFVRLTEQPSAPGNLDLLLVDPWRRVDRVLLFEGSPPDPFRSRALPRSGGHFTVTLSDRLQWYAEAQSSAGAVVARLGSATEPHLALAPLSAGAGQLVGDSPPVAVSAAHHARWVPVLLGGFAVAAAGATAGLATSAGADYRLAGDPATWAFDTQRLDASAHSKAYAAQGLAGAAIFSAAVAGLLLWLWR